MLPDGCDMQFRTDNMFWQFLNWYTKVTHFFNFFYWTYFVKSETFCNHHAVWISVLYTIEWTFLYAGLFSIMSEVVPAISISNCLMPDRQLDYNTALSLYMEVWHPEIIQLGLGSAATRTPWCADTLLAVTSLHPAAVTVQWMTKLQPWTTCIGRVPRVAVLLKLYRPVWLYSCTAHCAYNTTLCICLLILGLWNSAAMGQQWCVNHPEVPNNTAVIMLNSWYHIGMIGLLLLIIRFVYR